MSLLRKTLLLGAAVIVVLPVLVHVSLGRRLLRDLERTEERQVRADVESVLSGVALRMSDLTAAAERVATMNPDSLPPEAGRMFEGHADFAFALDEYGNRVWAEEYEAGPARNLISGAQAWASQCFVASLGRTAQSGGCERPLAGVCSIPASGGGILLLSCRSFRAATAGGHASPRPETAGSPEPGRRPRLGCLVVGRALESWEVEDLDGRSEWSTAALSADDRQLPAEIRDACAARLAGCQVLTRAGNSRAPARAGYALFPEISAGPAVVLSVRGPEDLVAHGRRTRTALVAAVLATALILCAGFHIYVERAFLGRVLRHASEIRRIARSHAFSSRVPVEGRDELSLLSVSMNEMLLEAQRSEQTLRQDQARQETLLRLHQISGGPLRRMIDFALEQSILLTEGTSGYLAFLRKDESVLSVHLGSRAAFQECGVAERRVASPAGSGCYWNQAIRSRRPFLENNRDRRACVEPTYPKHQGPILRHLDVPVFDGARMVAVVGVANKNGEYEEADIRQLRLLAAGLWEIMKRRQEEVEAWGRGEGIDAEDADELAKGGEDAEDQEVFLGPGVAGGIRMGKIVRALRESDVQATSRPRRIDLNRMVETSLLETQDVWRPFIEVTSELDPFLPPVTCDVPEIERILTHIMTQASHAIAHAREGDSRRAGRITVITRRAGRCAEVLVCDNGSEIPEMVRRLASRPIETGEAAGGSEVEQAPEGEGGLSFQSGPEGSTFLLRVPILAQGEEAADPQPVRNFRDPASEEIPAPQAVRRRAA